MIGDFLKASRDFIQLLILLLLVVLLLKLFTVPSFDDARAWADYRTAIAHIERKGNLPLLKQVERFIWRIPNLGKGDQKKAIRLLCKLAAKGKEEAELLLLIYDMGLSDCAPMSETAPK